MPVDIKKQGHYRLFETNHDHRMLVLGDSYFAWIHGQQSPILVHSDSDHEKDHQIASGEFYFVDFKNDPKYKDMPHLFLEKDNGFEEIMLPNGLPTESDAQKRIVKTDNTLSRDKLEGYLKHPAPAGPGEDRLERSRGSGDDENLPIDDYDAKTVDEITSKLDNLDDDQLEQVLGYEKDHKDRKTLVEPLEHRLQRS